VDARYFRVRGPNGRYYNGTLVHGVVVFNASFDDAMIMDESEILTDFPDHLPAGATLEEDK
jgi:hypothetical protein